LRRGVDGGAVDKLSFHGDCDMSMGGGPLFGSGGFYSPQGPYGPWAGCGCSSVFIVLAGILLVFGGCLRMFGQ
jgi:hypothetical protein